MMHLDLVSRDFAMTESIEQRLERRLARLRNRHGEWMRHARVRLGDTNGPRGGVDKFCRVTVNLPAGPGIHIEQISADLYTAIDVCMRRLDRALRARRLRSQSRARKGRQRALAHARATT